MAQTSSPPPDETVAFLRAEARFALTAGAMLLIAGFAASCGLAIHALTAETDAAPAAILGGPPLLVGWAACGYAALRLEQARALEAADADAARGGWRERLARASLRLRADIKRIVDFFRR